MIRRLKDMPARARPAREQLRDLPQQCRRGDSAGEKSEAFAVSRVHLIFESLGRGIESVPRCGLAEIARELRSAGIVQAEQRRLCECVGPALGSGMVGIALK